jgi:hypothetical protein
VPLDDLALVTGSDGSLALLNESAGVIMGRLLEGAGVDGAADALVARYGISRRQAAADAESAAEELVRLGLWQASTPTERRVQAEVGEPAPPEAPGWRFDEILAPIERPVRVQVSSPRLAKLVAAMLGGDRGDPSREPPAATISAFRRRGHELWLDGRRVLADADLLLARSELVRHLLLASGAERRWLAVLHAAVVSDGEAAVILSGASGSGKSTLAARLVASGLALVTDDYAPLEAGTHELWPTPFGLSAKSGSWGLLEPLLPELAARPTVRTRGRAQRYLPPPRRERRPRRPVALVFPAYAPGQALPPGAAPAARGGDPDRPRRRLVREHAGAAPGTRRVVRGHAVLRPDLRRWCRGRGRGRQLLSPGPSGIRGATASRKGRPRTRPDPIRILCESSTRGRLAAPLPGARRRGRRPTPALAAAGRLSGVHLLTPAVGAALEERASPGRSRPT